MSKEAMQMALEALKGFIPYLPIEHDKQQCDRYDKAITVLRQALEQEPFEYWNAVEGWVEIDEMREHFNSVNCGTIYAKPGEGRVPLYTRPQPVDEPVVLMDAPLLLNGQPLYTRPQPAGTVPHLQSTGANGNDGSRLNSMTRPDYCPVAQEPCQAMCAMSDVRCKIRDSRPQRKWVGLTDKEQEELMDNYDVASPDYAKAIEAKLKDKNT